MMSSFSRRCARGLLSIATWAAPVHERADIHEELGGLIDAATNEHRHGEAILHGVSSLRVVRPRTFATDLWAGNRTRHPLTWFIWSGLASVLIATEAMAPSTDIRQALYRTVSMGACIVLIYAAVAAPRGKKFGWAAIAAGATTFVAGDVLYAALEPVAFPSMVDASYLMMYPLIGVGVLLLFRSHSQFPLWQSLIPPAIAGGVAFAWWWDHMSAVGAGSTASARIVASAYPSLDVAYVVLATTIAARSRPIRPPLVLLAIAAALLALADAGYSLAIQNGTFAASMWMNRLWLGFFAVTAAAALLPSATSKVVGRIGVVGPTGLVPSSDQRPSLP